MGVNLKIQNLLLIFAVSIITLTPLQTLEAGACRSCTYLSGPLLAVFSAWIGGEEVLKYYGILDRYSVPDFNSMTDEKREEYIRLHNENYHPVANPSIPDLDTYCPDQSPLDNVQTVLKGSSIYSMGAEWCGSPVEHADLEDQCFSMLFESQLHDKQSRIQNAPVSHDFNYLLTALDPAKAHRNRDLFMENVQKKRYYQYSIRTAIQR